MTQLATLTPSDAPLRLRTPPGLLPDARHVVLPPGIVASGAPAIISTCSSIGIGLDRWQQDATAAILGKDLLGTYAADTVVLSIPRQVGKTFLVGAITFADSIVNPGTLTVWTAHRFKVARESFDELRTLAESEAMAAHVDKDAITTAAGNEVIPFRNGSRIVFAARERGSIRGFRKVRRLVLDEAQILTDAALSDLAPTQNQATNPQIVLMGTPPKPSDPGEAFTRLREEALSGEADGVVYIEFSADAGSDPDDRAAWSTANPSYPARTPERALVRLRRLLADDDFLREVLGIWAAAGSTSAIDPAVWASLADPAVARGAAPAFGVAVAPDASWSAIAVAWRRGDGLVQVMLADYAPGTSWVASRCEEMQSHWGGTVSVDLLGRALLPNAEHVSQQQQVQAHNALAAAVDGGTVRHGNEPALNTSVRGARWKAAGDARVLDRKGSVDISPLAAAALAFHAVSTAKAEGGWVLSL